MAGDVRYTPEQQRAIIGEIVKEIADGIPISVACKESGIAKSTFYKWLIEQPDFERDVSKAEGKRQAALIRELRAAGKLDWRAHGWQLERTSEDFRESKDVRVHVEKGVQQVLEAVRGKVSQAAWDEFVDAIADLQGVDEATEVGAAGEPH